MFRLKNLEFVQLKHLQRKLFFYGIVKKNRRLNSLKWAGESDLAIHW